MNIICYYHLNDTADALTHVLELEPPSRAKPNRLLCGLMPKITVSREKPQSSDSDIISLSPIVCSSSSLLFFSLFFFLFLLLGYHSSHSSFQGIIIILFQYLNQSLLLLISFNFDSLHRFKLFLLFFFHC